MEMGLFWNPERMTPVLKAFLDTAREACRTLDAAGLLGADVETPDGTRVSAAR